MAVFRGLVGPVDVEIEVARRGEIDGADAEFGQAPRRSLRARNDGAEPRCERLQQLDQDVDRAAGADAERDAVLDVGQRRRCRHAFARVLVHRLLFIESALPKRECPRRWRALHLSEPNSGPTNSANQLALAARLPSDFPSDAAPVRRTFLATRRPFRRTFLARGVRRGAFSLGAPFSSMTLSS